MAREPCTRYPRDEIIGKTGHELNLFVNDDEKETLARLLAEYGHVQEMELKVRTKQGDIRYGLFSGDIIESQGIQYFLAVMIDITLRKQAEADLQKSVKELRKALAEIKTLRGIVPICAQCKKIRDDKGYWSQVEAYISKHTEAEFSHSICPDCLKKLYPEFFKG